MSNSPRRLFSHIQNGQASRAMSIDVDKTKAAIAVPNVLQQNGYTRGHRFNIRKPRKTETPLKYKNQEPAICGFTMSKGYYVSTALRSERLKTTPILHIISTSQGVVSNTTAHKLNVGGELICSVF